MGNKCQINAAELGADVCGAQLYCLHGGRCNDAGSACICAPGYSGKICDAVVKAPPAAAGTSAQPTPAVLQVHYTHG